MLCDAQQGEDEGYRQQASAEIERLRKENARLEGELLAIRIHYVKNITNGAQFLAFRAAQDFVNYK